MRVRPGDLAIWVTRGALVDVERVFGGEEYFPDTTGRLHLFSPDGLSFVVRMLGSAQIGNSGGTSKGCYFQRGPVLRSSLRPIRDEPGEDEMLRIAGLPRREENVSFPPNVFTITID